MAALMQQLLNKLKSPKTEIEMVRQGVQAGLVEAFLENEDLSLKDVLMRLAIPASTYFAKKKNHQALDSHTTEKFLRLIYTVKLASDMMGHSEAKDWLYRKIPSLDNQLPIDLLDTETGYRLVEQALLHVKYGIYG